MHRTRGFVANISIGEPAMYQLVLIDTSSNKFWIQCYPCVKCSNQKEIPHFYPANSSTYVVEPYNSHMCGVYGGKRGDKGECLYKSKFPDQSVSTGTLGRDTLQFTTSDNGTMMVPRIAFGCGTHNAGGGFGDEYCGILGLGPGETSLVRQIGSSQFSFCIGSLIINDPYSHLIIGDGATIEGNPTPFEIYQDSYYVKLDGISIGEKQLAIDRKLITNFVTFDLRTPTTYLHKGAYEVLSAEVTRLTEGKLELVDMVSDRLCFFGTYLKGCKRFSGC